VGSYRAEIERCIGEVVRSCAHSPQADNLMLRVTTFDSTVHELHGFRPLAACDPLSYSNALTTGGTTALHDASVNLCGSLHSYGASLTASAFCCNAIVFVITDGIDNASSTSAKAVGEALRGLVTSESLDSVLSVLVGVDVSGDALSLYLNRLRKDAGFDRYLELGDASEALLTRLASFVSNSIGGPLARPWYWASRHVADVLT
jgi:hypothetical protein